MDDIQRALKADIIISYLCEIFREESQNGESRNPNFDLFLHILNKKGLIDLKDCSASEIGETLRKTFFKEIIKIESLKVATPCLKTFKVNQAIDSLTQNSGLNNYLCDLISKKEISVKQYADATYIAACDYLELWQKQFYAKYIYGKKDLFDSLNAKLIDHFEIAKTKKRR